MILIYINIFKLSSVKHGHEAKIEVITYEPEGFLSTKCVTSRNIIQNKVLELMP